MFQTPNERWRNYFIYLGTEFSIVNVQICDYNISQVLYHHIKGVHFYNVNKHV
jgi:hypothetical protein